MVFPPQTPLTRLAPDGALHPLPARAGRGENTAASPRPVYGERVGVRGNCLLRGGGHLVALEGRDDLFGEAVEVFELDIERGAERGRADHPVEAGKARLDG